MGFETVRDSARIAFTKPKAAAGSSLSSQQPPSCGAIHEKRAIQKMSIAISDPLVLTAPNRSNVDEDGHTISSGEDEILLLNMGKHSSRCLVNDSSSSLVVTPEELDDVSPPECGAESDSTVPSITTDLETSHETTPDADERSAQCSTTTEEEEQEDIAALKQSLVAALGNCSLPSVRRSILKSPESTNNTTRSGASLEVAFDKIMIRHYAMDIGDHPSCSIGAPIGLSWDFEEGAPMDVDVYEFDRRPRRKMRYLVLNFYRRYDILRALGYTDEDLTKADKERARVRRQRDSTRMLLSVSKFEEVWQSAGRKVRRACCGPTQEPAVAIQTTHSIELASMRRE